MNQRGSEITMDKVFCKKIKEVNQTGEHWVLYTIDLPGTCEVELWFNDDGIVPLHKIFPALGFYK